MLVPVSPQIEGKELSFVFIGTIFKVLPRRIPELRSGEFPIDSSTLYTLSWKLSLYWSQPMDSKGTVLITGLNGYLAGWVAEGALEEGYNVRGTVRRVESGARVQRTLHDLGYEKGRVEVVQVPDIAKPGAFDEVLRGI